MLPTNIKSSTIVNFFKKVVGLPSNPDKTLWILVQTNGNEGVISFEKHRVADMQKTHPQFLTPLAEIDLKPNDLIDIALGDLKAPTDDPITESQALHVLTTLRKQIVQYGASGSHAHLTGKFSDKPHAAAEMRWNRETLDTACTEAGLDVGQNDENNNELDSKKQGNLLDVDPDIK